MRDTQICYDSFFKSVEKQSMEMVPIDLIDLRSKVVDITNFHVGNKYFFPIEHVDLNNFIRLAIWQWYVPEEISFVLRMDLEQKVKDFSLEDRFLCEQFLSSKAEMLLFLQETNLWHTREFFGNLLKTNHQLLKLLKPTVQPGRVVVPKRKRGYDDHGSRVEDHKWKPSHDWSLTELMNLLYQERESLADTLSLNRGFLT